MDELNKPEEYLEVVIAENPTILNIESRYSGVKGPYAVFRQISFKTPQGRTIMPDIVLLAASGHIIVVEVKRHINPELKDRRVIAQIVDYAASFSVLSEEEIISLFNKNNNTENWADTIESLFPKETDIEELAHLFLSRFNTGRINLVIACDQAPTGIEELIKGIAKQETLEFDLSLVEIIPYSLRGSKEERIIFVPRTKLVTEVVSRTVVTVMYKQGDAEPSVKVETSSIEEIEENLFEKSRKSAVQWDERSFFGEMAKAGNEEVKITERIIQWARFRGLTIRWPRTYNPNLDAYIKIGDDSIRLFGVSVSVNGAEFWNRFKEYSEIPPFDSDEKRQELIDRLNEDKNIFIPGNSIEHGRKIKFDALKDESTIGHLFEVYDWFLNEIIQAHSGREEVPWET